MLKYGTISLLEGYVEIHEHLEDMSLTCHNLFRLDTVYTFQADTCTIKHNTR